MNIELTKLQPNENNPRKQLGDLEELTESIKANGVMQQLTVNDNEDGTYTIIIGHRRAEAAKAAGLSEVPCDVIKADKKKQIAMMLVENMTRTDLTLEEQAKAVQQCLDLGMTADELKSKTGFTKKKITDFKKIAKLNLDKAPVNATIDDFLKVCDIKDQKAQDKLLEDIGTNVFNYNVEQAKKTQKEKEEYSKMMEYITSKGLSLSSAQCDLDGYSYDNDLGETKEVDELIKSGKDFKLVKGYRFIEVYLKEDESEDAEETAEDKESRERENKRNELADVCYATRKQFIKDCLKREITKEEQDKIINAIIPELVDSFTCDIACEMLGLEDGEQDALAEKLKSYGAGKALLVMLYSITECGAKLATDWDNEYSTDSYGYRNLKGVYDALSAMDYKMSKQEEEVMNGTSEVYEESE